MRSQLGAQCGNRLEAALAFRTEGSDLLEESSAVGALIGARLVHRWSVPSPQALG